MLLSARQTCVIHRHQMHCAQKNLAILLKKCVAVFCVQDTIPTVPTSPLAETVRITRPSLLRHCKHQCPHMCLSVVNVLTFFFFFFFFFLIFALHLNPYPYLSLFQDPIHSCPPLYLSNCPPVNLYRCPSLPLHSFSVSLCLYLFRFVPCRCLPPYTYIYSDLHNYTFSFISVTMAEIQRASQPRPTTAELS